MQFLNFVALVLLNLQFYKFAKLYVVKDEQERDFGVPVVEVGSGISEDQIKKFIEMLKEVPHEK